MPKTPEQLLLPGSLSPVSGPAMGEGTRGLASGVMMRKGPHWRGAAYMEA